MITKKCAISFGGFAVTMLLFLTAMHLMGLFTVSKWAGVGAGTGVMALMLALAIILRKNKTAGFIIIPVNAVCGGIATSSVFVHIGSAPEIWQSAVIFAALCLAFFLYLPLTKIPFVRAHYILSMAEYCILLLGVLTVVAVAGGTAKKYAAVFYLAFISMIPFTGFFITLAVKAENPLKHIKNLGYASFAVLILVILAVLAILSGGDGLDGLGGGGGDPAGSAGKRLTNRNPYDFYVKNVPEL